MMSGAKGTVYQQASEIKRLSQSSREHVCSLAGVKHKEIVRKYDMMALKAATGLSWMGMATQKRMLKRLGVKYSSEKEERKERRFLLKNFIIYKMISFESRDEDGEVSFANHQHI